MEFPLTLTTFPCYHVGGGLLVGRAYHGPVARVLYSEGADGYIVRPIINPEANWHHLFKFGPALPGYFHRRDEAVESVRHLIQP